MTICLADNPGDLATAAGLLRAGKLVAFGTETVYGLGALSSSPTSIARVYAAKSRPAFNPLISHFPSAATAFRHGVASDIAHRLAAAFWPGPLTMILPRHPQSDICDLACAGLPTVALRVPSHEWARALLTLVDAPVAAPSANMSGCVSPTSAQHVLMSLNERIDAVFDTGHCEGGIESTVVDLSGPRARLLRPGGVTMEALQDVIGDLLATGPAEDGKSSAAPIRGPGMLASHYAPELPLRLDAQDCGPDEALLAFGPSCPQSPVIWNLSMRGDLTEAAARLYAGLHHLDAAGRAHGLHGIAVMPLPDHGLGLAIMDRLRRAAAPRPSGGQFRKGSDANHD